MSWGDINQLRYNVTKWILIGITIIIAVFALLALARVGLVFWLYSTVETWVTVRLGLDYYATQLLTTIIVTVVTLLLPSFAWYLLLGKKKAWGTTAMIGGQALIFLLVYTIGQDVYFDRSTGKPLRYYADTPEGRQFSFTPGFDPKYGIEFKVYTREDALKSRPKTTSLMTPQPLTSQTETKPTSNIFVHPSGRFERQGEIWVEYPPYAPGRNFKFKEAQRDTGFIYLYDETRHKENDPVRIMYLRLPINGGMAQWSFPNPFIWRDLYPVTPKR